MNAPDVFDVMIIGLGPAGSTLARLLTGKKVLCLDKKTFAPGGFEKPCGGLFSKTSGITPQRPAACAQK